MKAFQHVAANSAQEVVTLLSENPSQAKILAGGMDLLGEMKEHIVEPDMLISISRLDELAGIRTENGITHIGAAVTLTFRDNMETPRTTAQRIREDDYFNGFRLDADDKCGHNASGSVHVELDTNGCPSGGPYYNITGTQNRTLSSGTVLFNDIYAQGDAVGNTIKVYATSGSASVCSSSIDIE